MKQELPIVSIIIPTLNDAAGLGRCLESIKKQNYPQELIEIIVVDDGSIDNTVSVAKSYGAKVLMNGTKDLYKSWAMGVHASKGEFSYLLEQDIELRGSEFFQKMLKPLLKDRSIVASFTRKYPRSDQPWIQRFIAQHPCQCDPLYEFFSPSVESTIVKKEPGYFLCDYSSGKIPPFGRMFYRVKFLKKSSVWNQSRMYDLDDVLTMIKNGYTKFAYVPEAGIYHLHARTLRQLIEKRVRNLKSHYLPKYSDLTYKWFDINSKLGILKIIVWIIYANLFLPATIRGIWRAWKLKAPVLLMEPIVTIATTDVILWNFFWIPSGRKLILKAIRNFF